MEYEEKRTLDRHGWDIKNIQDRLSRRDSSYIDLLQEVHEVKTKQQEDHETFAKYIVAAEATREAAREAAAKAVTAKQLYVTAAGVVIALVGIIEAIPHK